MHKVGDLEVPFKLLVERICRGRTHLVGERS